MSHDALLPSSALQLYLPPACLFDSWRESVSRSGPLRVARMARALAAGTQRKRQEIARETKNAELERQRQRKADEEARSYDRIFEQVNCRAVPALPPSRTRILIPVRLEPLGSPLRLAVGQSEEESARRLVRAPWQLATVEMRRVPRVLVRVTRTVLTQGGPRLTGGSGRGRRTSHNRTTRCRRTRT